jgi:protein-tyrosine phosphatase
MDSSNYGNIMMLARDERDRQKVQLILNVLHPGSNMSVPDPYFGGEQGFENVFIMLDKTCDIITDMLQERYRV